MYRTPPKSLSPSERRTSSPMSNRRSPRRSYRRSRSPEYKNSWRNDERRDRRSRSRSRRKSPSTRRNERAEKRIRSRDRSPARRADDKINTTVPSKWDDEVRDFEGSSGKASHRYDRQSSPRRSRSLDNGKGIDPLRGYDKNPDRNVDNVRKRQRERSSSENSDKNKKHKSVSSKIESRRRRSISTNESSDSDSRKRRMNAGLDKRSHSTEKRHWSLKTLVALSTT